MKNLLLSLIVVGLASGCATPKQAARLPAGIVIGTVKSIDFSGLTGSKPFIAVGAAHIGIASPASLAGKDLLVESSDDYPFKIGDEVELDLTGIGIDVRSDGQLYTVMLYRFPIKVRPNQAPEPMPLTRHSSS